MMIARNWSMNSVTVEGRQHCYPVSSPTEIKLAGAIRRFLPSRRDREVPYGMKGGEL